MIGKKRKGQYLIVEQMVIFTIGIFVALSFVSIFGTFESDIRQETTSNQLRTYSKALRNKIVSLVETDAESETIIDIPRTLSEKTYVIELSNGLIIQSEGYTYRSDLMGLRERLKLSGSVISKRGRAKLEYNGEDTLKIGGV